MSKKYLPIILFITLYTVLASTILHAQIAVSREGVFTKCFVENTQKGAVLKAELQLYEGDEALYFDNDNNIRKYISDFEYPESRFLVVASYDISGNLSSIIFHTSEPDGILCKGAVTISYSEQNNPIFSNEIYWSKNYDIWEREVSISDSFPQKIKEEFDIYSYISISNLLKTIELNDIDIPEESKKVTFRRPEKYDMVWLNNNDPGWRVSVLDVETNRLGEVRYKVELYGKHEYLKGCEVEDVEVEFL